MVDFRVNDGLPWHPKTVGMTLPAIGLWTIGGAWCARYLTDGYIPTEVLHGFAGRHRAVIQELIDRNLITELAGGYQYVDWLQYQRSKAELENEREQWRQRQARARRKRLGEPDVTP